MEILNPRKKVVKKTVKNLVASIAMVVFSLGFGIVTLISSNAAASHHSGSHHSMTEPTKEVVLPAQKSFPWTGPAPVAMSESEFNTLSQAALKRASRAIAQDNTNITDDQLSKEFVEFRTKFLAIQKRKDAKSSDLADQLEALLQSGQQGFESFPNDLKFFVTMVTPLMAYKSFMYRIKPFTEQSALNHSLALSMVRNMTASSQVFLPTDQWAAVTQYVSEPFDGMKPEIRTSRDLQTFLSQEIVPAMQTMSSRLRALDLKAPIVWDNQLMYGKASFKDGLDRYRLVGEAERYALMSMVDSNLSQLCIASAYSMDDLAKVANNVGKLYAIDALKSTLPGKDVNGAPAEDRVHAIQKTPNFGKFIEGSNRWVENAGIYFQNSVRYGILSWTELENKPASKVAAMDPVIFNSVSRQMSLGKTNLLAMIRGETTIHSQITGEEVTVNIMKFFNGKKHIPHLQAFLPTNWEPNKTLTREINGRNVEYRNFTQGRAILWNTSEDAWGRILPKVKNREQMEAAMRVLSQAWGSAGGAVMMGGIAL